MKKILLLAEALLVIGGVGCGGAGPVDSTGPSDPSNPSLPTDPSSPANSTDSSSPASPTNPSSPVSATDPSSPTSPTDPTSPVSSTDPTSPTDQPGPVAPQAPSVWRGDFETGDRSQWSTAQMMGPDRVQVVTSPVRQGRYALRVEVRQGDNPIHASGNRNELVKFDGSSEGREFYYGWSTLWPSDYPMTPTWQVFMQWHHPGSSGAPPVRFVLGCSAADCGRPLPDTLFFIVDGKPLWTMAPVTKGQWHDFTLHVKWSANPSIGFVELWYDGKLVVAKRYVRTMFNSSDTNYLKMGLYRDAVTQPTAVLYQDGFVQATTFEGAQQPARSTDQGAVGDVAAVTQ